MNHMLSTDHADLETKQSFGRVDFQITDHQIIHFVAKGPFDKELVEALKQVLPYLKKAIRIIDNEFCEVIEFERSCEASPAFLAEFHAYMQNEKASNEAAYAVALVLPDSLPYAVAMSEKYRPCFEDAGIKYKRVTTAIAGFTWIREQLQISQHNT